MIDAAMVMVAIMAGGSVVAASPDGENPPCAAGLESVVDIRAVAVANEYAYLAAGYDGLVVAGVSDPGRPVEVGRLDTPGFADGIALAGRLALVADGYLGLRVIDIENPSEPVEVGWVPVQGWAADVAVAGEYALVAGGAGLVVADFSRPSHPVEVAAVEIDGNARRVTAATLQVCVTDDRGRVRVIDLREPTEPVEIEVYEPFGPCGRDREFLPTGCCRGAPSDRKQPSLTWIDAMVFGGASVAVKDVSPRP